MDYKKEIDAIKRGGLYRGLRTVSSAQTAEIVLNGQKAINFCSNNYLGLTADPRVVEAAVRATKEYGWGAGSSALISGQMSPHRELKNVIKTIFDAEDVLLFSSGYHANVGVIPALVNMSRVPSPPCREAGPGSRVGRIFSDELNHASIIDGCRLAKCTRHIYRHRDIDHLEELLNRHTGKGPQWIITESVFSMDGESAPLKDISELAHQYNCGLLIDEAHAIGVFGEKGRGLCEDIGLTNSSECLLRMGTFSKALGSYGAFVMGNETLIDYLLNRARTFIFTTNLPPAVAAASQKSLEIMIDETERRERLWENINFIKERLGIEASSPIIPWFISGNEAVIGATNKLLKQGYYVQAIRAPTVPEGKERLRITVSAHHTKEQIKGLVEAIRTL